MNERTRKQVTFLLLGLLLGYSFYQITKTLVEYTEQSEQASHKKYYRYSDDTIIESIPDEIEVQFNIIKGSVLWHYAGGTPKLSAYFNISIVNKRNEIRWINLPDNYYDVQIFNDTELIYSIRSIYTEVNESEKIFLAPKGVNTIFFHWGGEIYVNDKLGTLPVGNYFIVAKFRYNGSEYSLDGNTVEVYRKLEPAGEVV